MGDGSDFEFLLAFYADDFTGATDALEGLARNGVRAVLFLDAPTEADLARFNDIDAVGVAGTTRSMPPDRMGLELSDAFRSLDELDVPLVHYKVCSTFDSSPEIGSIGRAIDVGQNVFESSYVPVSQPTTAPSYRYVAFGNLFAEFEGSVYRLDRHPTMNTHPTTPMAESDLRRHLERQTDKPMGLIALPVLESTTAARDALNKARGDGEVIVFDGVSKEHLERVGRLIWDDATEETGTFFAVGSSGLEHDALTAHWESTGVVDDASSLLELQPSADAIAVTSGSVSTETAAQIEHAVDAGFEGIRLDTPRLVDPDAAADARKSTVERATEAINDRRSVVMYTAKGPDDPAIDETLERFETAGVSGSIVSCLGRQQGMILRELIERTELSRCCVAGGDTSSHVVSTLDVDALTPLGPISPGSPICRTISSVDAFDGLEFVLKGGKSSERDYFDIVRRGGSRQY